MCICVKYTHMKNTAKNYFTNELYLSSLRDINWEMICKIDTEACFG